MEQKVVKFEIGKLLAVIITIGVIALVAGAVLQSNYFQGALTINTNKEVIEDTSLLPAKDFWSGIEIFNVNIEKGLDYGKELENLKHNFDLMIKEGILDSDVATKTIDALSGMRDIEVVKVIEVLNTYIPADQDKDPYGKDPYGFAIEIEKVGIELIQRDVLIENVDALATASIIDAAIVLDVKESFIDSGVTSIETTKFDAALIETVNIYDNVSFDVAIESLNKEIEAGIDPAIAFDKFDSALDAIKQDVAIEITTIELIKSIAAIDKGIDVQLGIWNDTIDTLTVNAVIIDQGVLAKAMDAGKGFDVLAKSFDIFNANIKEMDIDAAIEVLAKDANAAMPGLLMVKATIN